MSNEKAVALARHTRAVIGRVYRLGKLKETPANPQTIAMYEKEETALLMDLAKLEKEAAALEGATKSESPKK